MKPEDLTWVDVFDEIGEDYMDTDWEEIIEICRQVRKGE